MNMENKLNETIRAFDNVAPLILASLEEINDREMGEIQRYEEIIQPFENVWEDLLELSTEPRGAVRCRKHHLWNQDFCHECVSKGCPE